jgi:ketosteroid isomerase-like protein
MTAADNKALIEAAFADLEHGDGRRFWDLIAEDAAWNTPGSTAWSGVFRGKKAIREDIFEPLWAQLDGRIALRTERIAAEGDAVVVECRGRAQTKRGKPYNNSYCMIYRFAGGKIVEIVEYMDTQLVEDVLEPPSAFRRAASV